MTVSEVFEVWKKSTYKGYLCTSGGIEGGPGFLGFGSCSKHSNVRYGCEFCPENCPDYCENTESRLFNIFMSLYRNSPSYYNEEFNIDENDPYYVRGYL